VVHGTCRTHHGIQGDRNKVKYGDYEMKPVLDTGKISVDFGVFGVGTLSYVPPARVTYESKHDDVRCCKTCLFVNLLCIELRDVVKYASSNEQEMIR
jgi:hypothetical protein